MAILHIINLILLLSMAASIASGTAAVIKFVYGSKFHAVTTDKPWCRCLATGPQVPVHREVCGPQTGKLHRGRQYHSLSTVPIRVCGRHWWPILFLGNHRVAWVRADKPGGGGIHCNCQRSPNAVLEQPKRVKQGGPSANLIRCICQVESLCNPRIGCVNDVGSLSCGPFQIKQPYWQDASRFAGRKLGGDWITCTNGTNNMACSTEAFEYYVSNYGPRCATPATDEVFARVHNGGPKGCQISGTIGYWNRVKACLGYHRDIL